MRRSESVLTEKGQVTIPREIRIQLGLQPGERLAFETDGSVIRLRPVSSRLAQGFGAVTPLARPENFGGMREQFEEDVAAEVVGERP